MTARVIAVFPGIGKAEVGDITDLKVIDLDTTHFDKARFPENYIDRVKLCMDTHDLVIVVVHAAVRESMVDAGIQFTLVYPTRDQRVAYRDRHMAQSNEPRSYLLYLEENWEAFIASCEAQAGCEHIVLERGQQLSDVLEEALA